MSKITREEAHARSLFADGVPVRDVRRVAEALGLDVEKTVRHYRDLQNARMQAPQPTDVEVLNQSIEAQSGQGLSKVGNWLRYDGDLKTFRKWFNDAKQLPDWDNYTVSFKIAEKPPVKEIKCTTCNDTGLYTITGDSCYAGQVHACPGGCKASRKYR